MLVISYATHKLRKTCLELDYAEALYGPLNAQELIEIIADMEATNNAEDYLRLFFGETNVATGDSILLPIGSEYTMKFQAFGKHLKKAADGQIIWSTVTRLKLMVIG